MCADVGLTLRRDTEQTMRIVVVASRRGTDSPIYTKYTSTDNYECTKTKHERESLTRS